MNNTVAAEGKIACLAAFRQAKQGVVSRRDSDYEAWVDNIVLDSAGEAIIASMDGTDEALNYVALSELAWDLKEKARIALEENETMRALLQEMRTIIGETSGELRRLAAAQEDSNAQMAV